jgi:hypothetical protein
MQLPAHHHHVVQCTPAYARVQHVRVHVQIHVRVQCTHAARQPLSPRSQKVFSGMVPGLTTSQRASHHNTTANSPARQSSPPLRGLTNPRSGLPLSLSPPSLPTLSPGTDVCRRDRLWRARVCARRIQDATVDVTVTAWNKRRRGVQEVRAETWRKRGRRARGQAAGGRERALDPSAVGIEVERLFGGKRRVVVGLLPLRKSQCAISYVGHMYIWL